MKDICFAEKEMYKSLPKKPAAASVRAPAVEHDLKLGRGSEG
jgi:hypothetical protein